MAQGVVRMSAFAKFVRYWLPALLYVSLIFVVSAQPRLQSPLHFVNGDKLAHILEYTGLGLVMVRAIRSTARFQGALSGGLLAMLIGLSIAACDEVFQASVPGRESSALDWLADLLGLVTAQIAYLMVRRD